MGTWTPGPSATTGDDTFTGDATNESVIDGLAGNDTLMGNDGADVLLGNDGNDTISGGAHNDSLDGQNGDDILSGGAGDDRVDGGAGSDWLEGGDGSDILDAHGSGVDVMAGGTGNDLYFVDDIGDVVNEAAGDPSDAVIVTLSDYVIPDNVETMSFQGVGAFHGDGQAGNDRIGGGDGDDVLRGLAGDDWLQAGAGQDLLEGGEGQDLLEGADDDDILIGGAGDDSLDGGAGSDRLEGGDGSNTLNGGSGADILIGSQHGDQYWIDDPGDVIVDDGVGVEEVVLTGLASFILPDGFENLYVSGGGDFVGNAEGNFILGGGGANRIAGRDGGDFIRGGGEADLLQGEGGDDTLGGLDGADLLEGGDGDDTLDGGEGADTMIGGAGRDTYRVDNPGDIVVALAGESSDVVATSLTLYVLGDDIADLRFEGAGDFRGDGNALNNNISGGAGDDLLRGLAGFDDLSGGEGDDVLDGGEGLDFFRGGAGNDVYMTDRADEIVLSSSDPGVDRVETTAAFFSLATVQRAEIENLRFVGAGAFVGVGNAVDNRIEGNGGADHLDGNGGEDTLVGGAGDDVLDSDAFRDVLDGGDGIDTVSFAGVTGGFSAVLNVVLTDSGTGAAGVSCMLFGIENVTGSVFNDALEGNSANNIFRGGAGIDYLHGAGGDDVLDGGDGDLDTASYVAASVGVTVSLAVQGIAQDTGGAGVDTLVGIERLAGSDFDDVFIGSAAHNQFWGFGGSDTISGGAGNDRFQVLALPDFGVDVIFGGVEGADSGFDTVEFNGEGGVIVQLSGGYATTGAGVLVAFLSGIEGADGTSGDDALIGHDGHNRLQGGSGSDWLVGGGGDDWFVQTTLNGVDRLFGGTPGADSGFDTIDYSGVLPGTVNTGVVVQLAGWATTTANVVLATFSGIEAAVGSSFDDALIGNASNNRIEGGAGSDWLVGQSGHDWFVQGTENGVDRLFGDAGLDTIDYSGAGASVTIQLNGWSTLAGGATLSTFTGIENAVGSVFNDALIGSAVDNRITGGQGADWLVGGGGDDAFVQTIDTTGIDRLFGGTPGADSGLSDTIDYSGASAGVVVQLSGYATTNGGGNITLATFAGIENATGSNSADALIGNASDNRLTGGGGADWLVGGLGADTFVYQSISDGAGDSIRDFAQDADHVDLSALDAIPGGADDPFTFATVRHAGVLGEAVASNFGAHTIVSLYLDADNTADMTFQIVHGQGVVMNAGDFIL